MSQPVTKYFSEQAKADRGRLNLPMDCDRKEEEELKTYFGGSKRKNMPVSSSSAVASISVPDLHRYKSLVIPADRKVVEANSLKPLISNYKLTEVECFVKISNKCTHKMTGYLSPNGTFFYLNKKGEMMSNLCSFELLWHIDVDMDVPFIGIIQREINKNHYNFALNCIFIAGNNHQSLGDMIRASTSPASTISAMSTTTTESTSPYIPISPRTSPYGFDSPPRSSPRQPASPPNIKLERAAKIAEARYEVPGFTIVPRKIWFNNKLVPEITIPTRM